MSDTTPEESESEVAEFDFRSSDGVNGKCETVVHLQTSVANNNDVNTQILSCPATPPAAPAVATSFQLFPATGIMTQPAIPISPATGAALLQGSHLRQVLPGLQVLGHALQTPTAAFISQGQLLHSSQIYVPTPAATAASQTVTAVVTSPPPVVSVTPTTPSKSDEGQGCSSPAPTVTSVASTASSSAEQDQEKGEGETDAKVISTSTATVVTSCASHVESNSRPSTPATSSAASAVAATSSAAVATPTASSMVSTSAVSTAAVVTSAVAIATPPVASSPNKPTASKVHVAHLGSFQTAKGSQPPIVVGTPLSVLSSPVAGSPVASAAARTIVTSAVQTVSNGTLRIAQTPSVIAQPLVTNQQMLSTLQSLAHLGQPVQVGTQPVSLQPGYNLNQIIIRPGVQLTSGPLISNVPIASKPVDGQPRSRQNRPQTPRRVLPAAPRIMGPVSQIGHVTPFVGVDKVQPIAPAKSGGNTVMAQLEHKRAKQAASGPKTVRDQLKRNRSAALPGTQTAAAAATGPAVNPLVAAGAQILPAGATTITTIPPPAALVVQPNGLGSDSSTSNSGSSSPAPLVIATSTSDLVASSGDQPATAPESNEPPAVPTPPLVVHQQPTTVVTPAINQQPVMTSQCVAPIGPPVVHAPQLPARAVEPRKTPVPEASPVIKQEPLDSPEKVSESITKPNDVIGSVTPMDCSVGGELPANPLPPLSQTEVKDKPRARVKPQIMKHIIEGFVIYEGSEPFPVQRKAPLTEIMPKRSLPRPKAYAENDSESNRSTGPYQRKRSRSTKDDVSTWARSTSEKQPMSPLRKATVQPTQEEESSSDWTEKEPGSVDSPTAQVSEDEPIKKPEPPVAESCVAATSPAANTQAQKPISSWTVTDVYEFLQTMQDTSVYADDFRSQEIDGQALLLLKEDHMMSTMNIKLGPALKICSRINAIKAETGEI